MFIVYSPEGQSAIAAADLKPHLRIDPTKRVPAVGKSELDETHLLPEDKKQSAPNRSAIQEYQSVQTSDQGQPLVHASEIMSSPVITVREQTLLADAWKLMNEQNIHHLPVIDASQTLVGIISSTEILQKAIVGLDGELEYVRAHLVADVMKKEVITTHPVTDIRKVALVMTTYQIGSVLIMSQDGAVQGMVTLSDLVRRLSETPPITLYA